MKGKQIAVKTVAKQWLKDPAFVAEYDALADEFALVSALIAARAKAGLTQSEVARRMGTTQAVISRIESMNSNPSLGFLKKLAFALNSTLQINFQPKQI